MAANRQQDNQGDIVHGSVIDGKVPDIEIGGVKLPAQKFEWQKTVGVKPYVTTFWTSPLVSEKLDNVKNPVTITINYPTTNHPAEQAHNGNLEIKDVYLVARKYLDPTRVMWTVADARWLLQGQQIYCVYNKTVQLNDKTTAYKTGSGVTDQNKGPEEQDTPSGLGGVTEGPTPADLRKQFETLVKGRYIPWTVNRENLTPYTVKEIVEKELKNVGIKISNVMTADLTYFIDNVIYRGASLPAVIEELLSLARLTLGVALDGTIYVTTLTEYSKVGNPEAFLGHQKLLAGCLYRQNKKKARPKSVKVLFEKIRETMFVCVEETRPMPEDGQYLSPLLREVPGDDPSLQFCDEEAINNGWVIGCVNVLPLPYPTKIDNVACTAGQYVPITKFLRSIKITSPSFMSGGNAPYFCNMLETRIRQHFIQTVFQVASLTLDQEKIVTNTATAIKNNWRKTYMIDPYCRDRMKMWQPRLASVINNYDHHTAPSPVFCDYFYLPVARNIPPTDKAITDWYSGAYNWSVTTDDPYLMTPSPAIIQVVSEPLGIFRTVFPEPLDPSAGYIGPFGVVSVPNPTPGSGVTNYSLAQTYPAVNHTMVTLMSVIWETNYAGDPGKGMASNIKDTYYVVEFDAYGGEGEFPAWEIKNYKDAARFAYPHLIVPGGTNIAATAAIFSKIFPGAITLAKNLSYRCVNEKYLTMLARYEADKVYTQFKDLIAGTVTLPAFVTDLKLSGNLMNIIFSVSPESGPTTTFVLLDTVPYPSLEATAGKLSQKYLDYLHNQVGRGDTLTYQHTTN